MIFLRTLLMIKQYHLQYKYFNKLHIDNTDYVLHLTYGYLFKIFKSTESLAHHFGTKKITNHEYTNLKKPNNKKKLIRTIRRFMYYW
jgi:hypothetical protein